MATAAAASTERAIIDAAIKAGVKLFAPSAFGSDTRNEKVMSILPQFFRGKRDTVDYLKEKKRRG